MKSGADKTNMIDRDSSQHHLILHPFTQHDTASLNFSYKNINGAN